jgi:hypothetical protein
MHRSGVLLGVAAFMGLSRLAVDAVLPEIYHPDPKDEHPWADVDLRIASMTCPTRHQCRVHAVGTHRGSAVGLEVVVGALEGERKGVAFRSTGEESNRFIRALADLYNVRAPVSAMKVQTFADAAVLGGDLSAMQSQRIDIKVFFSADGPDADYAELYTNIDPVNHMLEIHEKDPEYRANVIKALAK